MAGLEVAGGGPIKLTPTQSLTLSMILHELGTNAAKYGAVSCPEGRVRISWLREPGQQNAPERVRLCWEEREGPPVKPRAERGFGSRLIEQACTYQLNGSAELDFPSDGLTCRIVFPLG